MAAKKQNFVLPVTLVLRGMNNNKALQLRKKLRKNQTEFWGRVGVSQSCGSRFESGHDIPEPIRILLDITYGHAPLKTVAELRGTTLLDLITKGK